jgi:hypothetical protein
MILLFSGPLSAQRIGPLKKAAERNSHRSFGFHENSCNHNNPTACIKAKNKFQTRNKTRENKDEEHVHKDSAGPAGLKNPDF